MSLRTKLVSIIIILGILLISISTLFMLNYNKEIILKETLKNNNDTSLAISISLDNYLSELANTVATISSAPCLKDYILENQEPLELLGEGEIKERFRELNTKWASTHDLNDPFINKYLSNSIALYLKEQMNIIPDLYGEIFVTDRYGELLAATTKLTTFTHESKTWWLASYNEGKGKVHFDDRGYDESVGDFILGVVVPVYHEGEIIGILKCNMKIFKLFDEVIKDYLPLYSPGKVKIVRTSGDIVLEPGKQPLSTRLDNNFLPALMNDNFYKIYENENGQEILVSINHIKNTTTSGKYSFGGIYESLDHKQGNEGNEWAIVLTVSKEVIDKKAYDIVRPFIIIGIISILSLALFSFIFVGRITRNITKLVEFTERVGLGDLDNHITIRTKDEVGILANTFNRMVDRLKTTMSSKDELTKEIDKRIVVEERLRHLSTIDELTQLYNRRAFNDYLEKFTIQSEKLNEPLSILMLDIDYFKKINDKYGHNTGDELLRNLAKILLSNTRSDDIVSRWGGEEFIILMPNIDKENVFKIAERLRITIEETRLIKDIQITVSIGITEFKKMDSIEQLIGRVDEAQYMAKAKGRNNVQVI